MKGFFILLAACSSAFAQNASLQGIVLDPSAGVIVSASVTPTNTETDYQQSARTNSAGSYSLPPLAPGHYTLTSEAMGFQKMTREDVVLEVEQRARVDFSMPVGDSRQSVSAYDHRRK